MADVIDYRFRFRRRTAASWTSLNEILLAQETGIESDTGLGKIGDGATPWNSLLYTIIGTVDLAGLADDNFIQRKAGAWKNRTPAQVRADLLGAGLDSEFVGYRGLPQRSFSADTTSLAADAGGHCFHPASDPTARIFTIDSNTNVPYDVGTVLTIVNETGAGVVSIAITADTLRFAGTALTGTRSLAANGYATALKVAPTVWMISGPGLT